MKILAFVASMMLAFSVSAEPESLTRIIIDFDDDATAEDVRETEEELGTTLYKEEDFSAWKIATAYIDPSTASEVIEEIASDWDVENVERSQVYTVPEVADVHGYNMQWSDEGGAYGKAPFNKPNDEYYAKNGKQKWHFDLIGLEQAWQHSTGQGAVVAILDTGVSSGKDPNYPRVGDLKNTCFVDGYNFVDNNKNPYDKQSHGTHVASSVAESTNNEIGGVGVAFEACIMPMKVLSDRGSGYTEDIALAIRKATDAGAHVINMSLGGGGYSKIMEEAVQYAAENNVLVFCAAGNGSRDQIEYPASYDGCLAVSSVGPDGKLAYYSSYGKGGEGVRFASPGGNKRDFGDDGGVWQSTVNPQNAKQWGMFPYQGTSMATPIAAGVGALLVSYFLEEDGGYDRDKVVSIMEDSASERGDAYRYGAGVVHAGRALEAADSADTKATLTALALSAAAFFLVRRMRRKS